MKTRGFTLIELVVSIGILAIIVLLASGVLKIGIDSYRTSTANMEIMRNLRAIASQLNNDFENLRKDGEIFVVWDGNDTGRFDQIMFFATGNFSRYHQDGNDIRGNMARICYGLASRGLGPPKRQPAPKRILARTQHILTADANAQFLPDFTIESKEVLHEWHNFTEADRTFLNEWKNMPLDPKAIALSAIMGINGHKGTTIKLKNPETVHLIMCQGVGQFKIQGWHDGLCQWVPDNNDLILPFSSIPSPIPNLLYPYRKLSYANRTEEIGHLNLGGLFAPGEQFYYPRELMTERHFDKIPGLGRSLKFTFKLYDSKGIIKNGRWFTHIVYLN